MHSKLYTYIFYIIIQICLYFYGQWQSENWMLDTEECTWGKEIALIWANQNIRCRDKRERKLAHFLRARACAVC